MGLLSKPELVRLAVSAAESASLDPALLCAHIDVRSRWNSGYSNPTAISYLIHQNFPDPMECEYRSMQWGLMAIQGEFARQQQYQGPLPALLDPIQNLREGCRILRKLMADTQYSGDLVRAAVAALLAWNRENSQEFVAMTLRKLEAYRDILQQTPSELHTFQRDDNFPPQLRLQTEGNSLLEVGATTHTRSQP